METNANDAQGDRCGKSGFVCCPRPLSCHLGLPVIEVQLVDSQAAATGRDTIVINLNIVSLGGTGFTGQTRTTV
jgi:hypothetical protein